MFFGFICGGGCMAQWIAYRRNMEIGERIEREARRGLERLAALDRSQEKAEPTTRETKTP